MAVPVSYYIKTRGVKSWFSHEIPQKCSRLPPQLEKIRFFGVKSWLFTRNTPNIFVPPSAIGKNMIFFGVKSWLFTRNIPKFFAPPSAIGINMIFWRKIVIFHTKYPKNVRASLRSAQIFKCALLTWNPGSAPDLVWYHGHYWYNFCYSVTR